MANNRMYLVHEASRQRVLIAKHFGQAWCAWSDGTVDDLVGRLRDVFEAQFQSTGWPSAGWHLEFEHHSKHDDPLQPSSSETYQSHDGKWHEGNSPNRSRDDLVRLLGENGADNYLSFPDDRSHDILLSTVADLTAERDDLRDQVRRLTTRLLRRPRGPARRASTSGGSRGQY